MEEIWNEVTRLHVHAVNTALECINRASDEPLWKVFVYEWDLLFEAIIPNKPSYFWQSSTAKVRIKKLNNAAIL